MAEKIDKEKRWEQVQIKAFTAWVNEHLKKRDYNVQDIKNAFQDGVLLINFLELLSGKEVKTRWEKTPPSRIHKIQNLHTAMQFVEQVMKVKTVGVGAEDFADDNLKMILGFLWTLYKKYRISVIKEEDKSSEEGLLLWTKKQTDGYNGVNIESYKHSFKNGKAFLALVDKYVDDKSKFDYDAVMGDDPAKNLEAAFGQAESMIGIPKLLDVEETLSGNVDERSLVLYISLYFHAFKAKEAQLGLTQEKDRLASEMAGLKGTLEERAKLAEQLQVDNENLREELRLERDAVKQLKEKCGYLEEKVEVLQQLLEQENEEKEELEKRKNAELAAKQAEWDEKERQKNAQIEQLQKALAESQAHGKDLEAQVKELTAALDAERLARSKEALEHKNQNKTQVAGLDVLKRNLEQHVEDLHRWQKFLDIDSLEVDFNGEIRPKILSELSQQEFDAQLEVLSTKLGKENKDLEDLLKAKEAEQKVKQANDAKKKERQQKLQQAAAQQQ